MRTLLRSTLLILIVCLAPVSARASGLVYSWGHNQRGQLGDGSTAGRESAAQISGIPPGIGIVHTAAGFWHSLAVGTDGRIFAWGYNASGQLGDGGTADRATAAPVAALPNGVSAVAVSAGLGHSLALGSDGGVYSWGANGAGQLGNGGFVAKTPSRAGLPAGARAVSISAGDIHSLAATDSGAVYAWGDNEYGQTGGAVLTQKPAPVLVSGLAGRKIVAVAAGGRHSLALDDTGAVYAWGYNGYGQLGDGTENNRAYPVLVSGFPSGVTVTAIAAGKYHSIGLGSDGKAYTWGSNDSGELGNGASGIFAYRSVPAPVSGFPEGVSAASVAAGDYFSLATGSDGRAYAWGYNYNGQLGDGTTINRKNPVAVTGIPASTAVQMVSGGGFHSLGIIATPPPVLDAPRALSIAGGLVPATGADIAAAGIPPGAALDVAAAVRLARRP